MRNFGPKPRYSDAELFEIRRSFNAGLSDAEIANRLEQRFGRRSGWEAIRKARRKIGLRKIPTCRRWVWTASPFPGCEVCQ